MFEHCYFESHMPATEAEKDFKLVELLKARSGNAVVYCASSNAVQFVQTFLKEHGMEVLCLHKRMRPADQRESIANFISSKNAVLVTAEAITSEILPAHVRLIVHFNYPVSMAEYLREVSVAGRDGMPTRCALLYYKRDKRTQKRNPEDLREVIKYGQSSMCRTIWLGRFAKNRSIETCQRCDNCLRTPKTKPVEEKKRIDLDAILEASM